MSRRLPPLGPLRAFEAAARHGHFLRAAQELCVTPGAISQQVRQLEEWLGTDLFLRVGRGVKLNETGKALLTDVSDAFDRMELSAQRIRRQAREGSGLTVSTVPSFSARWLIPRLGALKSRMPAIDVRILASSHPVDFAREAVDMAIRHGRGHYPGLECRLLYRDIYIPVCSPRLLQSGPGLAGPDDLRHYTLLHEEMNFFEEIDWPAWLAAAGVDIPNARKGPYFNYTHMTVQAALDGQGVALTPAAYVLDDLEEGRLIRPFALAVPDLYANYLVCPKERAADPVVAAFWSWALDEVQIMERKMEELELIVS
jgi:LysR family glycine cleavage system transcriptional activator